MERIIVEQFDLYCQEDGADKLYHGMLVQVDGGWRVDYLHGARGGKMKPGTKHAAPVEEAKARKDFAALLKEKLRKKYQPIEGSNVAIPTFQEVGAKRKSGVSVQLSNEITEAQLTAYLNDDGWVAQIKENGERQTVSKGGGEVLGGNRLGEVVPLTTDMAEAIQACGHDMLVLDGELLNGEIVLFDVLECGEGDLRDRAYEERLEILARIVEDLQPASGAAPFRLIRSAFGREAKIALLEEVRAKNWEGLVFKRLASGYTPSRPNSGGDHLKFKLWEMATCHVTAINDGKRSVRLAVYDTDGTKIDVGNVTIPSNVPIPQPGSFIEVKYLYVKNKGGSLFEPSFERVRTDVRLADCRVGQLKYHGKESTRTANDDVRVIPAPAA